jgi:hypothetical protein
VKIIDRDELRADNLTIIELQRGQPVFGTSVLPFGDHSADRSR